VEESHSAKWIHRRLAWRRRSSPGERTGRLASYWTTTVTTQHAAVIWWLSLV